MVNHIEIVHELDGDRYPRKVLTIEPDLGDLRKSTDKALPAPPKTPKRVLMKYRFSAFFPIFFSIASFVLALVLVLAGRNESAFSGQYLVALQNSAGEQAPAHQGATKFKPLSAIDSIGTAPVYYLYLHKVCYDSPASVAEGTSSIVERRCESYSSVAAGVYIVFSASGLLSNRVYPGLPMLTSSAEAPLSNSGVSTNLINRALFMMSVNMAGVRKAVFASLVVSLIGSLFSAIWCIPGIVFPHSQLLAHMNICWPLLSSIFTFLAATMLSIMIAGVFAAVDSIIDVGGAETWQGVSVLFLVWLAWAFVSLSVVYWWLIWFVEVRRSSFTRRKRSEEEVGNWKGIAKEVWTDLKTEKTI